MSDEAEELARENPWFRAAIGLVAVAGSLAAFGGLFFFEIPARNENALMFAMGIVFGWGSSVFASEYGASSIGRKVAEGAVKRMDRAPMPAAHAPEGQPPEAEPTEVVVVNPPDAPVPITDKGKAGKAKP